MSEFDRRRVFWAIEAGNNERFGRPITIALIVPDNWHADHAGGGADYGVAGFFVWGAQGGYAGEFLLDYCGEFGHLAFHLDHFFSHVEDNFDAGQVDAHVAG